MNSIDPATPSPKPSVSPSATPTPSPTPSNTLAPPSPGYTYYVSKSGNDNNPGTESLPLLHIQTAVDRIQPGNSIFVASGIYPEIVQINRSGTQSLPLSLDGSGQILGVKISGDFIKLSGLTIDPQYTQIFSDAVLWIQGSFNWIENVTVQHVNNTTAINIYGSNNTVTRSKIRDSTDIDAFRVWGHDQTISYNEVTGLTIVTGANHSDFIQTFGDNGDPSYQVVVEGNFVHDIDSQPFHISQDRGDIHHWTFRNNIFFRVKNSGFTYVPNTYFYNNLFFNSGTNNNFAVYLRSLSGAGSAIGSILKNNVFIGPSLIQDQGLAIADYNYFSKSDYSAPGSMMPGAHNIYGGDPMFMGGNPLLVTPTPSSFFKLKSNSPLIDRGISIPTFNYDLDQTIRNADWDMGPFEYK